MEKYLFASKIQEGVYRENSVEWDNLFQKANDWVIRKSFNRDEDLIFKFCVEVGNLNEDPTAYYFENINEGLEWYFMAKDENEYVTIEVCLYINGEMEDVIHLDW